MSEIDLNEDLEFTDSENEDIVDLDIEDGTQVKSSEVVDAFSVFLPGVPIEVRISNVTSLSTKHAENNEAGEPTPHESLKDKFLGAFNPFLYEILLVHGDYNWKIYKRYNELFLLHKKVIVIKTKTKATSFLPTKEGEEARAVSKKKLAPFPGSLSRNASPEEIEERRKQFEEYLSSLMSIKNLRENLDILNFFEVSPMSFRKRLGPQKYKEGIVLKLPRSTPCSCCLGCGSCDLKCCWQERWLVVKDSYIAYLEPYKWKEKYQSLAEQDNNALTSNSNNPALMNTAESGDTEESSAKSKQHKMRKLMNGKVCWRLCRIILIDRNFRFDLKVTGSGVKEGIVVNNSHGQFICKANSEAKALEWMAAITTAVTGPGRPFAGDNRHMSFAPQRSSCRVQSFIDGGAMMQSVASAIEHAKHEIFMTGWWLTPELFLRRLSKNSEHSRLDLLLKKKAEQGVRVCVLVYKEIEMALAINSGHTARHLRNLHPNIHVLRHPNHLKGMVLFWSHHEKSVIIDQSIAFIGGVDICYGRWDTPQHKLIDVGPNQESAKPVDMNVWKSVPPAMATTAMLAMVAKQKSEGGASETSPAEEEEAKPADAAHVQFLNEDQAKTSTAGDRKEMEMKKHRLSSKSSTTADAFGAMIAAKKWKKHGVENAGPGVQELADGQMGLRLDALTDRKRKSISRQESVGRSMKTVVIHNPAFGKIELQVEDNDVSADPSSPASPASPAPASEPGVQRARTMVATDTAAASSSRDEQSDNDQSRKRKMLTYDFSQSATSALTAVRIKNTLTKKLQQMRSRQSEEVSSSEEEFEAHSWLSKKRSMLVHHHHHAAAGEAPDVTDVETPAEKCLLDEKGAKYLFPGKDYVNWLVKDCTDVTHPAEDLVDRNLVARVPWHDTAAVVCGPAAADFARHFIQRWNDSSIRKINSASRREAHKRNVFKSMSEAGHVRERMKKPPPLLLPCESSEPWQRVNLQCLENGKKSYRCHVQALRSVSTWSLGCVDGADRASSLHDATEYRAKTQGQPADAQVNVGDHCEMSICRAYVNMIENAENYVYIENQFFISWVAPDAPKWSDFIREDADTPGSLVQAALQTKLGPLDDPLRDEIIAPSEGHTTSHAAPSSPSAKALSNEKIMLDLPVRNPICDAIYKRILKAHREKRKFRVYIMIPLLAAFEGEVGRPSGLAQQAILHYTRRGLFQGEYALFPRLEKHDVNPYDYVCVGSLRTWDTWADGRLASEMVYIHNKLMIVDDRKVILGSANLNDRSMLGCRDSELALLIEDEEASLKEIKVDGRPTKVGKFARRFRKALMAEHLGVLAKAARNRSTWDVNLLDDPVCDAFFKDVWMRIAKNNMELYDKIFMPIPANCLRTFRACEAQRAATPPSSADPEAARKELQAVQGHLQLFPADFLCEENIAPGLNTKEGIVPESMWT